VNESGTHQDSNKRETALSTTVSPMFFFKNGELWSTNNRVYEANVYRHKINRAQFWTTRHFDREYLLNGSSSWQARSLPRLTKNPHIPTSPLVFGLLAKKIHVANVYPPKVNTVHAVYANAISFARWRCYERNFNP